jgi:hypothetical protein
MATVLTGEMLDRILWAVSRDYIDAPGAYREESTRLALLIASLIAGAATCGRLPLPTARAMWRQVLFGMFVIWMIGGAFATAGGLYGKLWKSNPTLAPAGRWCFCEGLKSGSAVGTILVTVFVVWRVACLRKQTRFASDDAKCTHAPVFEKGGISGEGKVFTG